jgi:hypothetical protein
VTVDVAAGPINAAWDGAVPTAYALTWAQESRWPRGDRSETLDTLAGPASGQVRVVAEFERDLVIRPISTLRTTLAGHGAPEVRLAGARSLRIRAVCARLPPATAAAATGGVRSERVRPAGGGPPGAARGRRGAGQGAQCVISGRVMPGYTQEPAG